MIWIDLVLNVFLHLFFAFVGAATAFVWLYSRLFQHKEIADFLVEENSRLKQIIRNQMMEIAETERKLSSQVFPENFFNHCSQKGSNHDSAK